jgi:UDP-GlcNAc:undecaprenyl-phosphate/decaprenyl-phosphate GlcNAc-1-phosphate transferase
MISELVKKFLIPAGEHPEHNILAKSLLFPDAGFFWLCVFTFMLALFLCLYLTPLVIQAAIRYDIVDRPDGRLKTHTTTTAYLGGVSIYLAFLFALSLTIQFSEEVLGLLLSGTMIILLGIIDDLRALSPKLKLFGQAVAVLVLIKSGIHIQIVFLPEGICLLLTFLWLMATINAFNIIDVMDGLSTGTGAVCSVVLFIVALLNGLPMIAIITISLTGALFGFLRFNIAPARIYLGDAGSMFLGLMLGSLAMVGSYTDNNDLGCLAPVLILGVPLFDTMFVMYIRWRRGVSVILGSPDHFALRLRKWRLSTRQTVLLSYGASAALGLTGLGLMLSPSLQVSAALLLTVIVCGLTAGYYMKKIDMTM